MESFANSFRTKFWETLRFQIKNTEDSLNRRIGNIALGQSNMKYQVELAMSSLKLIENDYDKALPSNYESISNYLWNLYLNKISKENMGEKR